MSKGNWKGVGSSGVKYSEAINNPTPKQKQALRDRWKKRAIESKSMVARQLRQYGFNIKNITSRQLPFDLVILQPPTVVAISHQAMHYNYFVPNEYLRKWVGFGTNVNKVVIFVMSGQALRFLPVSNIVNYPDTHGKGYIIPCREVSELSTGYIYI